MISCQCVTKDCRMQPVFKVVWNRLLWVELHLKLCLKVRSYFQESALHSHYKHSRFFLKGPDDLDKQTVVLWPNFLNTDAPQSTPGSVSSRRCCKLEVTYPVGHAGTNVTGSRTSFIIASVRSSIRTLKYMYLGTIRSRPTAQSKVTIQHNDLFCCFFFKLYWSLT